MATKPGKNTIKVLSYTDRVIYTLINGNNLSANDYAAHYEDLFGDHLGVRATIEFSNGLLIWINNYKLLILIKL